MMAKTTFALLTMLGHAALAGRLERTAAAKGSSAPQTGDLATIREVEFMENDWLRIQDIEKAAKTSEAAAQQAYTDATTKISADTQKLEADIDTLEQENKAKQGSLTYADYNDTWLPTYKSRKADLQSKVAAQKNLSKHAAQTRDSELIRSRGQRTQDVTAAKLEAMRNVSRNKPERALQVLEALYHARRTRDSGKGAKIAGSTALGAIGGAAAAGAAGFLGGECLGQCGYAVITCDVGGTEAGQNAAGLACGEQLGAVTGVIGGLAGGATACGSAAQSGLGDRGYTRDEQALIDLMCANEEVAQTFKKW